MPNLPYAALDRFQETLKSPTLDLISRDTSRFVQGVQTQPFDLKNPNLLNVYALNLIHSSRD